MSKLEQMRSGMESILNIDSDIGILTRADKENNGRGQLVPTGELKTHRVICRVSYQSGNVWGSKEWEGGLSIDNRPYVLAKHDADIEQHDILEWRGKHYNIGTVTRPEIDGGFVCAQAPLELVTEAGV